MNGRKFSAKREEILKQLQSTKTHPGAYWVYEQLKSRIPDLSLGTVYRNLNVFCKEGKILSLGVVKGEERFDGISSPHPHFICSCCGTILDLPMKKAKTLFRGGFCTKNSFLIDFRKTVFYGLCGNCRENSNKDSGVLPLEMTGRKRCVKCETPVFTDVINFLS